jgi:undecaprenyl-diphosphatase
VARLRPSNLQNPISDVVHVVNGYRGGNYSFPSAHAANSWGLAIFITMLFRNRWLSISMILWALLTCYSRMYLGVHYFGDLLIGMLIGCLGACIVYLLLTRFTDIKKPEKIEHTYVPIVALVATVVVFLGISAYQCLWP